MLPQHTELHGQAAEVLRTTMVGEDKVDVALGEGPIEGQFFIRGMRWHEDRRARRGVLEDAGRRGSSEVKDIERTPFQIGGDVIAGRFGIHRGGIQGFMAQEVGKLPQFARMLLEIMHAQRYVSRYGRTRECAGCRRASGELRDDGLCTAHGQRGPAFAQKDGRAGGHVG